jgi:hypothetical protein
MGLFENIANSVAEGLGLRIRGFLSEDILDGPEIVFSAIMDFSNPREADITRHAVEEGAPLTDNIRIMPYSINLAIQIDEETNITNLLQPPQLAEKRLQIIKWFEEKTLLLFWYENAYENVVLSSLNEVPSRDSFGALRFDIILSEIRIATAEITGLIDKGFTALKVASDEADAKLQALL